MNIARVWPVGASFVASFVIACSAAAFGIAAPSAAYADDLPKVEIPKKYQEEVERTTAAYEKAQAKVDDAKAAIEANRADIAEIEKSIPEQKERTAQAIRDQYKLGKQSGNVIEVLLGSDDISAAILKLDYITRVSEANAQEIDQLAEMKSELEDHEKDLVKAEWDAKEGAAEAKEALDAAKEARQEAQRKAQEEARRQAELLERARRIEAAKAESLAQAVTSRDDATNKNAEMASATDTDGMLEAGLVGDVSDAELPVVDDIANDGSDVDEAGASDDASIAGGEDVSGDGLEAADGDQGASGTEPSDGEDAGEAEGDDTLLTADDQAADADADTSAGADASADSDAESEADGETATDVPADESDATSVSDSIADESSDDDAADASEEDNSDLDEEPAVVVEDFGGGDAGVDLSVASDGSGGSDGTDGSGGADGEEEEFDNNIPLSMPTDDGANWKLDQDDFVKEWGPRIDNYLAGSALEGQGNTFAKAAWTYGIDPRWSPAISNTESSRGAICFRPHNAWGWGDVSWSSWEEAIDAHVAGLSKGYGYTITVAAAQTYCPPNWAHWYNDTISEMSRI